MGDEWIVQVREQRASLNLEKEGNIYEKKCIYKVPKFIRDHDKYAYSPQVVSLGPYHHHDPLEIYDCCDPYLNRMEPVKHKIFATFLKMSNVEVEVIVEAMKEEADELMCAYDGLEELWTDAERFTELMILDGSFVLAYMLIENHKLNNPKDKDMFKLAMSGLLPVYPEVLSDMILLENQLPFRAVQILAGFFLTRPEMVLLRYHRTRI